MQVGEQEGERSRQRQRREDPEERTSHMSQSLKVAEQSEGRHVCEADGESGIRVGQVDRAGRQKGE